MTYRFGTFEFDAREGTLRRQGRLVPLEPKPARALALLLERAGELVTREEVRAHLWDDDTHVDFDRTIAYCLGQVRQALGDRADNPRFVQTVPRRGFRFIAPAFAREETVPRASAEQAPDAREATIPRASAEQAPDAREANVPRASAEQVPDAREAPGPRASAGQAPDAREETHRRAAGHASGAPEEVRAHASAGRASVEQVPPRLVRSIGRYATIAVVAIVLAAAAVAFTVVQGRSSSSPPVVAVARFDNETGDSAHDRVLSRMTDDVVERLTALGVDRLGVVGNHALLRQPRPARDLDAIGRDTEASYVVLVQLQERARELSLLLQLIRLSDGVHVWVRRMPLTAGEVDGADEQVATRIEAAVRRFVLREQVDAP